MSLHFVFCHHFVVSPHPQSPTTTLVGQPVLHFGADVPVIIFRREQAPYQFSGLASPMMPVTLAFRSADSIWLPHFLGGFKPLYLVSVSNLSGLPPPPDPIRVLGPLPVHVLLGPHQFLCSPPGPLQVLQPPPSPGQCLEPPASPGHHPPGPPGPLQVLEPPPTPVLEPPASSGQCLGPPPSPVHHPAGPSAGPQVCATIDRQVDVKFVSEGITKDEIDRYFQRKNTIRAEICLMTDRSMGCGASELRGTTLIGFQYDKGIIVGAESRASNELEVLNDPLRIRDQKNKMVPVSSHIIFVVQGVETDCTAMTKHMSNKFPNTGKVYTVSSVVETMYKYLESLNDKEKACGAIIAGWDASGPHVHRVFLKNQMVHKESACYPAAIGSGQTFALGILNKDYTYVMSTPYATNLGGKALYNPTYYDKHSGGKLTVYHIDEDGWEECDAKDALEAHIMYYDLHDRPNERKTLFLVMDAKIEPAISANDIADHFKPYAKLFASHRVALYKSVDDHFYFHRLVFESQHDAERAYNTSKSHDRSTPS